MRIKSKVIDEFSEKILKNIPSGLKTFADELENTCKLILRTSFEQLNLVTREEFEIQQKVLLKTREKIEKLEQKVELLLSKK